LSGWHPVDLAAHLMVELLAAESVDSTDVDDVILGCISQVGAQSGNIARRAVLAAGWPETVPGVTVDRHGSSSAQAVHWAAQAVASGAQDLVVAGGVEVMTAVPLGAALAQPAIGKPYGLGLTARYRGAGGLPPPGLVAEELAREWSLSRADLDAWAVLSVDKASRAQAVPPSFMVPLARAQAAVAAKGPGPAEVAPKGPGPAVTKAAPGRRRPPKASTLIIRDEAVEYRLAPADVASLAPVYVAGGSVTAANMAAEGDGASAILIASRDKALRLGLAPKATFVSFATAGVGPAVWPMAAVPAALEALRRAGLRPSDIDRWYVHESSAAAVLAWSAALGVDLGRVNWDGGALASTAPIGAVGAGQFASAVAGLSQGSNGLALVCGAGEGGVGTATVLARLG
jgi:acetyl-CoA acyltransferase